MSGINTSINIRDNMSRYLREMSVNMNRLAVSVQRGFNIASQAINNLESSTSSSSENINSDIDVMGSVINRVTQLAQKGINSVKNFTKVSLSNGLELGKMKSQMEGQFQARLGSDSNGTALFKHLQEQARVSAFSIKELSENTFSFLSIVENSGQLDKLNRFAEQMAMFDATGQGLEGAGLSIKEALSGDTMSLATKFNMSKPLIQSLNIDTLGKDGDIDGFITQFEKLLEMQRMGESAYNKMLENPKVKIDMFLSNLKTDFAEAGNAASISLNPIIDKFEKWCQSDSAAKFFDSIRSGLAWIIIKGYEFINFVELIGTFAGGSLATITKEFSFVIQYITSANGTLGALQDALISIGSNPVFRKAMSLCASSVMLLAHGVTWGINVISDLHKRFGWMIPIVVSLISKFYLFKTINNALTTSLISTVNYIKSVGSACVSMVGALRTATVAQSGLNTAMNANPYWQVFRVIIALVSAIGTLILSMKALKQEAQLESMAFETVGGYSAEIISRSRMTGYSVEAIQQMDDVSQGYKKRIENEEQKLRDAQKAYDTAEANYILFKATGSAGVPATEKESFNTRYFSSLEHLEKQKKESEKNIKLYKSQRDETNAMIGEQDKLSKLNKDKITEDFKLDFDMPGFDNLENIDNVGAVGSVDKINDTVDIASEDLQYFRDAAEAIIIDRSTINTIVPQIQVSFGDVRETADLNKVEDYIKQAIQNGLNTSPELITY